MESRGTFILLVHVYSYMTVLMLNPYDASNTMKMVWL